jgi:flagellar protein FlbD
VEDPDGSGGVIRLHRLNGQETVVNAELLESVESNGAQTVLTLATGNKIVVQEPVTEVIEKTIAYKKTVFAGTTYLPEFLRGEKERNNACH